MTNEERIDRIIEAKVPIYRHNIPALGIVKDCATNLSIKNEARAALRKRIAQTPELIERYEKELELCN